MQIFYKIYIFYRGEPIRLLLAYAGVDFIDKRYKLGQDGDKSDWTSVKSTLGFDFPNVSFYLFIYKNVVKFFREL